MKAFLHVFGWITVAISLTVNSVAAASEMPLLAGLRNVQSSANLQALVDRAVAEVLKSTSTNRLATNELAVSLVDMTDSHHPYCASYRGGSLVYPASVVKLFYLVAAHRWMEDKKLTDSPELRRAMRDMIVESYNEATHYVVDVLTGTTSGPELSPEALAEWAERRNSVNRYFRSVGFEGINVNKKPWCEGPYGREMQAIKAYEPKRNFLTTDATARLLAEIALGDAVSPDRSRQMMELLARDPFSPATDPDDQAHGFTGIALQPGMKLWSKAGWTSEVRHDAAYVELTNGSRFVLVVFTENHATERDYIPRVAKSVVAGFLSRKPQ
ncbi:MAG TPA: serine hydrolase [Candidatus Limnocylindria bacterium]|jgi:hypothetical protein|nr:serine hydrolase [Candidatus Limnocylindria bacterium]